MIKKIFGIGEDGSLEKRIKHLEKEFQEVPLNSVQSTNEKKIKFQKPVSYFILWIIFFLIIPFVFIYGFNYISLIFSFIFITIPQTITQNEFVVNNFGRGTTWISIFIILNILILPIYFFIKDKAEFREKHFKISFIILILILIPSYFFSINSSGPTLDASGQDAVDNLNNGFFASIKDIFTATKCAIPTNQDSQECISFLNTNNAEVDSQQTISIRGNNLDSNTYTLMSPQDYIRFQYSIDTPISIEITKIECYSSKDFEEPFFTQELNENIQGTRTIGFNCENVGELMENEEERYSFRTILYYETTTTHSIQVPALNCQYSELSNYLQRNSLECRDVSLSDIRSNVEDIPDFNTRDLSSNIISMGIDSFKNLLPLRLQDSIENTADLGIVLTPTTNAGNLQAGEIRNIVIPEILTPVDENEITRVDELESGETLFLRKRLLENENIQINSNQILLTQTITFDIFTQLAVRKNHNTIRLRANFEIENNQEETQTNTTQQENSNEDNTQNNQEEQINQSQNNNNNTNNQETNQESEIPISP